VNSYTSIVPDSSNPNPWYVCSHVNPGAETRLFLFPYAGGGPSVFGKWLGKLPAYVEGYIAHYPGRGSRHQEPPINRLPILVEGLYQAIQPLLDKPFAFFGHSLGALVGFELTRQLCRNNLPQPTILFVSANAAPHLPDPHQPIHKLGDEEFLLALQKLDGIPSELINQSDIMELFLPVLRADFEAIESYDYLPGEPLNIPIMVFGGLADPRLSRKYLEGWALHTNAGFKLEYLPGDHFFINTAKEAVIDLITTEMKSSYAKN
jgi:medium-chain acyl-[acyl-carrier-protein] hydrolase